MNTDKYFDKVIVKKQSISDDEKNNIINDIIEKNKVLPIKKTFTKNQLMNFNDNELILYFCDVNELFAINFFLKN